MKINNLKNACAYFRAYCVAKGLKDGDECKAYEYMAWINGKHNVFRGMHKEDYPDNFLPLHKDHLKPFENWLFEEARKEAQGDEC